MNKSSLGSCQPPPTRAARHVSTTAAGLAQGRGVVTIVAGPRNKEHSRKCLHLHSVIQSVWKGTTWCRGQGTPNNMEIFFQRFKKVQGNANLSQGTCPGAELRARGRPRAFSQPACPLEPSSPFSVASVTVEFAETPPLTWHRFSACGCLCKDWIMAQSSFVLYILNYLFKSGYLNYFWTPSPPSNNSSEKTVHLNP